MSTDSLLLDIARTAARAGGRALIARADKTPRVSTKRGPLDFVTDADLASEEAIFSVIGAELPGDVLFSEEAGVGSPGVNGRRWIIDPLDGTNSFLHGFPYYAVSVAVEVDGRLEAGVILDPVRDELFEAKRGDGAFLGAQRLTVSRVDQLPMSLFAFGFPQVRDVRTDITMSLVRAWLGRCGDLRRGGSTALDLAYTAAGRVDGYFELGLEPYDVAAGFLILSEAQGTITDFRGDAVGHMTPRAVLATNGILHSEALKVVGGAVDA